MNRGPALTLALSALFLAGAVALVNQNAREEKAKMRLGVTRDEELYRYKLAQRAERHAQRAENAGEQEPARNRGGS